MSQKNDVTTLDHFLMRVNMLEYTFLWDTRYVNSKRKIWGYNIFHHFFIVNNLMLQFDDFILN